MATTLKRGYRYPSQGVEPDAAGDIQKLAEDVANDVEGLQTGMAYAKGIVHESQDPDGQGAFSIQVVTGRIPTFTFKAGRRYRIGWDFHFLTSVANTYMRFSICTAATTDGATVTTGLTELRGRVIPNPGASLSMAATVTAPFSPSVNTTVQVKFVGTRAAGTGTGTITTTEPIDYWIMDLGAQL